MSRRKGIILAGGSGSRLYPVTAAVCKQLLPVYDKPMIYYPLSTLMLAGIREILIISTPSDIGLFKKLMSDGSQWGVSLSYAVQKEPNGIAQALIIARDFLSGSPSLLILGDNIFYGNSLQGMLQTADQNLTGASVFAYHVKDPQRFGIVELDHNDMAVSIEEKPEKPKSNYAVTGLYFFDETASEKAENIVPSQRGELEITDLLIQYLNEKKLHCVRLGRGYAWLDTGTFESLVQASSFVQTIEQRQGYMIACLEEIAYQSNWIGADQLTTVIKAQPKSNVSNYLSKILLERS